ncbi:uncharacterized protein LOC127153948 [Labeo rohita]|uniref:uncharacterized protein LOC127153948 n=1 Tax=Labeo rohita TaxID=84645 RepID=UPI0021E3054D|nr:uncharacterized protein LOC127153948 [Labeo rohita]
MRTMWFSLFYLLLVCQTTETIMEEEVNLGENVTLECMIDVKDIYWVFLKPPDYVVVILRTFSSESTSSLFYQERLKDKYSTLTLSRLFISNVTIDELGIYYCAKTGSSLQLSDGTRLYTTAAQDQNETELNSQTQQTLIVLYVILSTVMFSAVIGLFQVKRKVCKKRHQQCQNEELEQLYSANSEEFSEVEFHLFHWTNNTFVPFQKPKAKLRQI